MSSRRARRRKRKFGWIKCPKCNASGAGTYEEGQPIICVYCNHEWDTVTCCWQCGRPWGDLAVKREKRKERNAKRTIKVRRML